MARFTGGGLLGSLLGSTVAVILAPESGGDLQRRVWDRIQQARIAGTEAQAAKEEELIRKFRAVAEDRQALGDTKTQPR